MLCSDCLKVHLKHQCNHCLRAVSCTRKTNPKECITDECKGYLPKTLFDEKIYKKTKGCTNCGVLLRASRDFPGKEQTRFAVGD